MFALVKKLAGDKKGVTAIEYGLIAALVSVVIVAVIGQLEGGLTAAFTAIANTLTNP